MAGRPCASRFWRCTSHPHPRHNASRGECASLACDLRTATGSCWASHRRADRPAQEKRATTMLLNAGSAERGPTHVASDGLLDARTALAAAYMGSSPEMSVVDR